MTGPRGGWRSIVEIFQGALATLRAQRDLRTARRLQREGRYSDAFKLALFAFVVLTERTAKEDPAATAMLAVETVFLDELARQVGQPAGARQELVQALTVCEDLGSRSPNLQPKLDEYIRWYKHRLSEESPEVAH